MAMLSNLLIIEPETFQLNWLQELCRPFVKQTHRVFDGESAFEFISRQGMPDALICDLNMSGMDGVTFLRHLAEHERPAPVLLLSAASQDILHSVVKMASMHGVTIVGALKKPASRQQVSYCLQRFFAQRENRLPRVLSCYQPAQSELIAALDRREFHAYFQPQLCTSSGTLKGVEALARWLHPEFGILLPHTFIEPMTRYGLLSELSRQLLEQAVVEGRRWQELGIDLTVSVNVSPSALFEPGFAERVFDLLARYQLPGHRLCIEITEKENYADLSSLLETAARLRLQGIKLSIDDFGTGHASLLHLVQSPVSELKIDRVFVANMLDDLRYRSAIEACVSMARHLRIRTVAEGVETQEQARLLTRLGCDALQGFYFSPAMRSDAFVRWWHDRAGPLQWLSVN